MRSDHTPSSHRSSAIRNAEIAGNVLGVSAASTVRTVVGLERSTFLGMSSVLQRDETERLEKIEKMLRKT